jgi:hypothetical protein
MEEASRFEEIRGGYQDEKTRPGSAGLFCHPLARFRQLSGLSHKMQ